MNRRRTSRSASAEELLSTLQHLTARAREEVGLHQARVELAQALQRKMLPADLPAFPGVRTAPVTPPPVTGWTSAATGTTVSCCRTGRSASR